MASTWPWWLTLGCDIKFIQIIFFLECILTVLISVLCIHIKGVSSLLCFFWNLFLFWSQENSVLTKMLWWNILTKLKTLWFKCFIENSSEAKWSPPFRWEIFLSLLQLHSTLLVWKDFLCYFWVILSRFHVLEKFF